MPMTMYVDS